eukprot:COSAG06_NODE_52351_length_306_cov_0.748792_1_plen_55_part_10
MNFFNELPPQLVTRVLLSSTHHDDLIRWVSVCSQVCCAWRDVVARTSPAYGLGLP